MYQIQAPQQTLEEYSKHVGDLCPLQHMCLHNVPVAHLLEWDIHLSSARRDGRPTDCRARSCVAAGASQLLELDIYACDSRYSLSQPAESTCLQGAICSRNSEEIFCETLFGDALRAVCAVVSHTLWCCVTLSSLSRHVVISILQFWI